MVRTLPFRRQIIRLTLLSFAGLLTISWALWYSCQLRLIEQVTTPTGATIERVTTAHGSWDAYFDPHSTVGHGQGGLFAPTIGQQGRHYQWRLMLG